MRRLLPYSCPSGKWVYEKERFALDAIRWMKEHGQIRHGYPYKCTRCPGWHVTSTQKSKHKKKTAPRRK